MRKLKTSFTILFLFVITSSLFAQVKTEVNKDDLMYRNGRINVVVTILTVILCGLFFYVWRLDKKITQLENND